jgi:hypothetical protein
MAFDPNQLPPELRQRFMAMLQQQRAPGAQGGAQPQPPQPGMLPLPPGFGQPQAPAGAAAGAPGAPQPGPGMLPIPGQAPGAPMQQQKGLQQSQQMTAATPEEAAKARVDALRRAGAPVSASGLLETPAPQQQRTPGGIGNVFAADKNWFPGLFDTTNRVSPFDSFFIDDERSRYWL